MNLESDNVGPVFLFITSSSTNHSINHHPHPCALSVCACCFILVLSNSSFFCAPRGLLVEEEKVKSPFSAMVWRRRPLLAWNYPCSRPHSRRLSSGARCCLTCSLSHHHQQPPFNHYCARCDLPSLLSPSIYPSYPLSSFGNVRSLAAPWGLLGRLSCPSCG